MSAAETEEVKHKMTQKEQVDNLRREIERVHPNMPFPPPKGDQVALAAIDSIMIFAQTYHEHNEYEGQIEPKEVAVNYYPNDTMVKHSDLYGMYWQIDETSKGWWFLQKK